jgi:hypothetical protein
VWRRVLHACVRCGLIDHHPEPHPDGPNAPVLTPLELIDKIAALVGRPWCSAIAWDYPRFAALARPSVVEAAECAG